MKKQLERIKKMEALLDESEEVIREFEDCFHKYVLIQDAIAELEGYYTSKDWRKDYEDDEKNLLPKDLKRGVLSEDAVYDLLSDNDTLMEEMIRFLSKRKKPFKI